MAPGGSGSIARRWQLCMRISRRLAPGGTCPLPGGLEAVAPSGVKHVVFLELWLGIASLKLWLRMADEHEKPLSCGSGWQVLPVWQQVTLKKSSDEVEHE
ncbi:hypothetical protein DEO72_LG10g1758 [Vigna unguiculata]|uniref:Uncharacterized protein n=1 Tax=Vigna unguiculata TaxID=3917 RepID=A0A4D6NB23_VIGUN|nr:hypothetical protein DEO72_LG10g1758 [Vigna unguiculata]